MPLSEDTLVLQSQSGKWLNKENKMHSIMCVSRTSLNSWLWEQSLTEESGLWEGWRLHKKLCPPPGPWSKCKDFPGLSLLGKASCQNCKRHQSMCFLAVRRTPSLLYTHATFLHFCDIFSMLNVSKTSEKVIEMRKLQSEKVIKTWNMIGKLILRFSH